MKRLLIIAATLLTFVIVATAQAEEVGVIVSPIATPHVAHTATVDRPHAPRQAVIWLDWVKR